MKLTVPKNIFQGGQIAEFTKGGEQRGAFFEERGD